MQKNIFYSTYEHAFKAIDYIQELSLSLMEELSRYKLDFEDSRSCITIFGEAKSPAANSEESQRNAANINVYSVSIHLQEKP